MSDDPHADDMLARWRRADERCRAVFGDHATVAVSAPPVVRQLAPARPPRSKSATAIIAEVAWRYGLRPKQLLGKSRQQNIMTARHRAIRAVKTEHPHLTSTALGRIFNRHHTSILDSLKLTEPKEHP